jgi:hypothetical protein
VSDQPTPGRYLAFTNHALEDHALSDEGFYVLGHYCSYLGRNSYNAQLQQDGAINKNQMSRGRQELQQKGYARFAYPRLGEQKPVRLVWLADFADPRKVGDKYIMVSTAATSILRGKSSLFAVRLFALCVREQKRTGAVQIGDREIAFTLSCSQRKVKLSREKRLIKTGLLQLRTPAALGEAAIYVIPPKYSHTKAPIRSSHDPSKTRYLRPLHLGALGDFSINVIASHAERAAIVKATENHVHREGANAVLSRLVRIQQPIEAATLLDGPLARIFALDRPEDNPESESEPETTLQDGVPENTRWSTPNDKMEYLKIQDGVPYSLSSSLHSEHTRTTAPAFSGDDGARSAVTDFDADEPDGDYLGFTSDGPGDWHTVEQELRGEGNLDSGEPSDRRSVGARRMIRVHTSADELDAVLNTIADYPGPTRLELVVNGQIHSTHGVNDEPGLHGELKSMLGESGVEYAQAA